MCCNHRYKVGAQDLYEGLQQSAQLYVDFTIAKYDQIKMLHIILLVITIVIVFGYILFMLLPYLRYTNKEVGAGHAGLGTRRHAAQGCGSSSPA